MAATAKKQLWFFRKKTILIFYWQPFRFYFSPVYRSNELYQESLQFQSNKLAKNSRTYIYYRWNSCDDLFLHCWNMADFLY